MYWRALQQQNRLRRPRILEEWTPLPPRIFVSVGWEQICVHLDAQDARRWETLAQMPTRALKFSWDPEHSPAWLTFE